MVRWSNLMYMLSHLHTTLYAYSLYAVLNFISHAVMSIKEMFVSRCIYHFRGGWVGIAHSRSYDVFLDPAHSFFVPTPKHGGDTFSHADWQWMQYWCEASNAKDWNAKQCDVMRHPIPRSKSPLTAVAENKCRAVRNQMNACQWFAILGKSSQINYLTLYEYTCTTIAHAHAMHRANSRWCLTLPMCYAGLPRSL